MAWNTLGAGRRAQLLQRVEQFRVLALCRPQITGMRTNSTKAGLLFLPVLEIRIEVVAVAAAVPEDLVDLDLALRSEGPADNEHRVVDSGLPLVIEERSGSSGAGTNRNVAASTATATAAYDDATVHRCGLRQGS
jgi:hypothetical protein